MSPSPRILVAEDDNDIREIVRTRLKMAGFDVRVAHNGREALNSVMVMKPDAMVLDINMPELDGFGVLEALKTAAVRPPPTLVLTARNAADDVRRAMALGAKDYLAKPFTEKQLLDRVNRLLRIAYIGPSA